MLKIMLKIMLKMAKAQVVAFVRSGRHVKCMYVCIKDASLSLASSVSSELCPWDSAPAVKHSVPRGSVTSMV